MCCKYYFGIILTILFILGLIGCFKYFGMMQMWFWTGLTITSLAGLLCIAET